MCIKIETVSLENNLGWNRKRGEDYVLNKLGLPPKVKENKNARRKYLDFLQPLALRESISRIVDNSPIELKPYIESVFVYSPPSPQFVNAFAEASGKDSRIVHLDRSLFWVINTTVHAIVEITPAFREGILQILKRQDKLILPPDEAFAFMLQASQEIAPKIKLDGKAKKLITLLSQVNKDKSSVFELQNYHKFQKSEDVVPRFLTGSSFDFVLCHELSHHLLNHTRRSNTFKFDAPGFAELESFVNSINEEGLGDFTRRQQELSPQIVGKKGRALREEYEADLLGLALLCRSWKTESNDVYLSSHLGATSFPIALLALSLANEGDVGKKEGLSSSHPSFLQRSTILLEYLTSSYSADLFETTNFPELGRSASMHPNGWTLQIWGVASVVAWHINNQ